ncbi:hypothetical protein M1146_05295 [Patescibacteria group bacterium]|nr:hypothetical protein [Patescibacteria group bacterium]
MQLEVGWIHDWDLAVTSGKDVDKLPEVVYNRLWLTLQDCRHSGGTQKFPKHFLVPHPSVELIQTPINELKLEVDWASDTFTHAQVPSTFLVFTSNVPSQIWSTMGTQLFNEGLYEYSRVAYCNSIGLTRDDNPSKVCIWVLNL